MIPSSPISTLFPYTTLFRSHQVFLRNYSVNQTQSQGLGSIQFPGGEHQLEGLGCSNQTGQDEGGAGIGRSEEHTSELQSQSKLVCRLLLEKKNMFLNSWICF